MSPHRAWLVTIPLVLAATAITLAVVTRQSPSDHADLIGEPLIAGILCVLLVLSTIVPLRFTVRRQTYTAMLTELPLILSLYYLPPLAVLLVRVIASTAVQSGRKAGWVKGSFNVANVAAATACANAVIAAFGRPTDLEPRTWMVLGLAVAVSWTVNTAGLTAIAAAARAGVRSRRDRGGRQRHTGAGHPPRA
jgi:hypothetical protein